MGHFVTESHIVARIPNIHFIVTADGYEKLARLSGYRLDRIVVDLARYQNKRHPPIGNIL